MFLFVLLEADVIIDNMRSVILWQGGYLHVWFGSRGSCYLKEMEVFGFVGRSCRGGWFL